MARIDHLSELQSSGFVVLDGEMLVSRVEDLRSTLDRVTENSAPEDVKVSRLSTRISGLSANSDFEPVYKCPQLIEACRLVIGTSFKLSSLHARNVHPGAAAQDLHVDFRPGERPFPLVGYIYMIDDFNPENGATRFVPGSHMWSLIPEHASREQLAGAEAHTAIATGEAGSLIIFYGTTWHGHGPNHTATPRRSLQGAFVPG